MFCKPDSGEFELAEVFPRVQRELFAQFSVGRMFEHPTTAGHASEHTWLELFESYLPAANPAFSRPQHQESPETIS